MIGEVVEVVGGWAPEWEREQLQRLLKRRPAIVRLLDELLLRGSCTKPGILPQQAGSCSLEATSTSTPPQSPPRRARDYPRRTHAPTQQASHAGIHRNHINLHDNLTGLDNMAVPRIPYTSPFPPAIIRPSTASTLPAALSALRTFLWGYGETYSHNNRRGTLLLTGAGISVKSGLADYRGENGTYRLNKAYRPIYFTEFVGRHESRKR